MPPDLISGIPMMGRIKRQSVYSCAANEAPYFIPLLGNVMVGLAKALQVTAVPKKDRITFVRLYVIDNLSGYNSASILAHMAKRMTPELPVTQV